MSLTADGFVNGQQCLGMEYTHENAVLVSNYAVDSAA